MKIKIPSSEQMYFSVMKWSKYHTNGCNLMCTNKRCDESYVSWIDNYPKVCKKCGARLWEPQDDEY